MLQNKALYWVSLVLVLIGGIDLGFRGLFNHSLLEALLGGFARFLFILMGLGAIFLIINFIKTGGMQKAVSEVKHDIKPEAWKKDSSDSSSESSTHSDSHSSADDHAHEQEGLSEHEQSHEQEDKSDAHPEKKDEDKDK